MHACNPTSDRSPGTNGSPGLRAFSGVPARLVSRHGWPYDPVMNPTVTDAATPVQNTGAAPHSGGHDLVRIRRQDGPGKPERWEECHVPGRAQMNVISLLQWIAAHPVTADGKQTTSPVWESACLEEVCGAC